MDYGVNFNGNQPLEEVNKGARASEVAGFNYIWVGENPEFVHPFQVVAAISAVTEKATIGSGIISPLLNRCPHIKGGFEVLREAYGERHVVGLAPGDGNGLRKVGADRQEVLNNMRFCLNYLRSAGLRVFLGASGPKMLEISKEADGVLLNYVHPEYIRWARKHSGKKNYSAAFAPALTLPDRKERSLLISAAVVASGANPIFLRDFGLEDRVARIRDLLLKERYSELSSHTGFLLDNFTLSGGAEDILERIDEIRKQGVNQVILGPPFSSSIKSIRSLGPCLDK